MSRDTHADHAVWIDTPSGGVNVAAPLAPADAERLANDIRTAIGGALAQLLAELRAARAVVASTLVYKQAHDDLRSANLIVGLRSDDLFRDLVADVDARADARAAIEETRASMFDAVDAWSER